MTVKKKTPVALAARNISRIQCHACKKFGHRKSKCFNVRSSQNKHLTGLVCNFCNRPGHKARFCWNRRRSKGKASNNDNKTSSSQNGNVAFFGAHRKHKSSDWILDSGASQHMCNDKHFFHELKCLQVPCNITIGDSSCFSAKGQVNVSVKSFVGENCREVKINDVLFVSDLAINLFSLGKALDAGFFLLSVANEAKFVHQKSNEVYATAIREVVQSCTKCIFKISAKVLRVVTSVYTLIDIRRLLGAMNVLHIKT